jgi:hypothetical protein
MTKNVLILTAMTTALLAAGWLAALPIRPDALKSRHSEPATTSPPASVAVTAEGKLYHRPECTFIHGPAHMEPGTQAVAEGYTPCVRCLKRKG